MASHATAAAAAREPEQAPEIARTVAEIAVETRSARMRREPGPKVHPAIGP